MRSVVRFRECLRLKGSERPWINPRRPWFVLSTLLGATQLLLAGCGNANLTFEVLSPKQSSETVGQSTSGLAPHHLAFVSPASSLTAGNCTALVVQVQDVNNSPVVAAPSPIPLTLVSSASGTGTRGFYQDSACSSAASGTQVVAGTDSASFYYQDTLASSTAITLTSSDGSSSLLAATASLPINPAAAASLLVSGHLSPVNAGSANSITLTTKDLYGNVATGYTGTVHFTSSDGAAVLPVDYTFVAGDNGTHTFTSGVTLKTVGTQSVTATDTVTGSITGSQSGIIVNPAAVSVFVVTGHPSPVTAGSANSVTVTAKDSLGNVATGYTGTVHFTSSDGAALLPADYSFVAGDNGTHTFTSAITLKTAGTQSVIATDTVTSSITGSQSGIVVNPGAASTLLVSGHASPVTAGSANSINVTAKDSFGNVATGYTGTVHFTSSDGAAVLPADYIFVAGDNGSHTFTSGVTLKTVGTQSVTATDTVTGSITSTQSGIVVNPAAVSVLVVTGHPSPVTAGSANSITVTAKDSLGNVATGYTGTVHFTSSDGTAVLPADYTFVAGDNGTHTFTSEVTLKTAGTQSVTATDTVTGTITGSQTGIVVNPGTVATLLVNGHPSPVSAGSANSVTVTAKDTLGNIATGYTGTVQFTSSDGTAVLPADYSFVAGDNGTHTFTSGVTLKTAGTQSVTATDTVTGTIAGSQSGIVVNPGTATKLVFLSGPSSVTAGVCSGAGGAITVQTQDANGNTAPVGGNTDVTLSSTGNATFFSDSGCSTALTGSILTIASSTSSATFYYKDTLAAASATLTAIAAGLTPNPTFAISVNAGPATQLAFSTQPANAAAGAALASVRVTVQDSFSNTITTDNVTQITVAIGTNPGAGLLSGTKTVSVSAGVATFSDLSIDKVGTGYTLGATSSPAYTSATSNTFNITLGSASKLAFTTQPVNTAAGATLATVQVAVQDSSGNVITNDNTTQITLAIGTNPSAGTLSGTTTATVVAGVANFSTLSINNVGNGYTLTATSNPSYATATSSTFNILGTTPLQIAPLNPVLLTGEAITFSATGGTPAYSFTDGGSTFMNASSGLYTIPLFSTPGVETVTAHDSNSLTSGTSVTVRAFATKNTYETPASYHSTANAMAQDSVGNIYAVGYANIGASHWIVRKWNGSAWNTVDTYQMIPSKPASASAVLVTSSALFVGGNAGASTGPTHWVIRRSLDGGTSWTTVDDYQLDPSASTIGSGVRGIAEDSSGNLFAVGYSVSSIYTHWIVRKSTDSGATWFTVQDFQAAANNSAEAYAITTSGTDIYVAGIANNTTAFWTVQKSSDSGTNWTTVRSYQYVATRHSYATAIAASGSTLYVAGWAFDSSSINHWLVEKSTDGGANWSSIQDYQLSPGRSAKGASLVVSGTDVYSAGSANDSTGIDHMIVNKYDGTSWSTVLNYQLIPTAGSGANGLLAGMTGIYVAGYGIDSNGSNHWLVKSTTDSGMNWSDSDNFQASAGGTSLANGIATSGVNYFIGGTASDQWVIRKSNDSGATWSNSDVYQYTASKPASANAVGVDSATGSIYAVGKVTDSSNTFHWVTKRSMDGGISWTLQDDHQLDPTKSAIANSVLTHSSGIYVAGNAIPASPATLGWQVRKSTNNGGTWSTSDSFNYTFGFGSSANSITADSSGNIHVAGYGRDSGSINHWIVRSSSTNGSTWSTLDDYQLAAGKAAEAKIVLSAPSGLFVAGIARDASNIDRWIVRKSTNNGSIWSTVDDFVLVAGKPAFAYSMISDLNGHLYVAGSAKDNTNMDYWVIRKSRDGGITWRTVEQYQDTTGLSAIARTIALDSAGNLIVGGQAANALNIPNWFIRMVTP